jgi:lipoprotein-anchoring transpeptidase ErfK/SrfK
MPRMLLVILALAGAGRSIDPDSPVLRLQVLLDRAHFSPGEIDAEEGSNTRRALLAFEQEKGLATSETPTDEVWQALDTESAPALVSYTLIADDVAGPFETPPADMMDKARVARLGYASPLEKLAEKFHASPRLLQRLNPGASFEREGDVVRVPNVPATPPVKAEKVVVDADQLAVIALDAENKILARYPASVGSEHDPLPNGSVEVKLVKREPFFFYNPDLFWDADESHAKAKLPPGPNSPVGVVWIGLSLDHYGIHGTPEPSMVGKTQSHGCIRLTNWDATELAELVSAGTPVELVRTER